MNEHDGYSYVNQNPPSPAPEAPLTWRDAAGPALALGLSLLIWAVFSVSAMMDAMPGLGIPVFTAAFYLAVLVITGRRPVRSAAVLLAASLLLAASCAVWACDVFTVLNCFLILALSATATFLLSGQSRFGAADLRILPETIRLTVFALFTRIDAPFRAAGRLGRRDRGRLIRALGVGLGTLVLLAVVLALLASADMVFGSFFTGVWERLEELEPARLVWRIIRTVGLALLIASGLQFVREPAPAVHERARPAREKRAAPFLVPVLALCVVYMIFCIVQLRYLFGGAEAASMAGGWAEYARTGFFQLVAVAGIDLVLCLLSADADRFAGRSGRLLRLADGLLLLLTAVILASAWFRMHLYIAAFGLSILRLMTLWGMLMILCGLLLAAWKLLRPAFRFGPVFLPLALGAWCLFCLAGPAARVADYNVDAFLDGRLTTVDVDYLESLGTDARPALGRLAAGSDASDREIRQALKYLEQDAELARARWTTRTWSAR